MIDGGCKDVDLTQLVGFTKWHPFTQYFELPPGEEHYKLLAHIALKYNDVTLADIGTFLGFSALALSINPNNKVITYDIEEHIPNMIASAKNISNIEFRIKNLIESPEELKMCPFIFFDVDPHDGIQELNFVKALIKCGYKGTVMFDDIYLNDSMRSFWNWVYVPKVDVTKYGHHSGTGIAYFGGAEPWIIA